MRVVVAVFFFHFWIKKIRQWWHWNLTQTKLSNGKMQLDHFHRMFWILNFDRICAWKISFSIWFDQNDRFLKSIKIDFQFCLWILWHCSFQGYHEKVSNDRDRRKKTNQPTIPFHICIRNALSMCITNRFRFRSAVHEKQMCEKTQRYNYKNTVCNPMCLNVFK